MSDSDLPQSFEKLAHTIDSVQATLGKVQAQQSQTEQSMVALESRVAGILKLDAIADADVQQRHASQNALIADVEAKLIDTKSLAHENSAGLRRVSTDLATLRTDFDNTASAAQTQMNGIKEEMARLQSELQLQHTHWTLQHAVLDKRMARQRILFLTAIVMLLLYAGVRAWYPSLLLFHS